MDKLLTQIYWRIRKWKPAFFLLVLAFLGMGWYFISKIQFNEDITNILPKSQQTNALEKVFQQVDFADKITVMISADNKASKNLLPDVSDVFLKAVEKDSVYIDKMQGKVSVAKIGKTFSFVYNHLPLFLNDNDYQNIEKRLARDSIKKQIQEDYQSINSLQGFVTQRFILRDPLGLSFIGLKKLRSLGISDNFIIDNGYIATADSSTFLMFITPHYKGTNTKKNAAFVHHLYQVRDSINHQFQGEVNISYFGSAFVALANANQIKSDIMTTVILAVAVLMLILILFYKRIYIPLILFVPAVCGATLSLTLLYFFDHSISAISISVGAILLGVTLDYSLHVITHFREHPKIKTLYQNITKPLLGCSITTAAAFFCLLFVKSKVLQDLGLFAGLSVLFAAIFALILMPHLYQPKENENLNIKSNLIDRIAGFSFEKSKIFITVILVAIIIGLFSFSKVTFDNNISHLNYFPKNMKASQQKLEQLGNMGGKSIYVAIYGDSLNPILTQNTQLITQLNHLKKTGSIKDFSSVGCFVLSHRDQQRKIEKWKQFWKPEKKAHVIKSVAQAARSLGLKNNPFKGVNLLLDKKFKPITIKDYKKLGIPLLTETLINKNGFITLSTVVQTDSIHRLSVINALQQSHLVTIDRKHISEQFLGQIRDDFNSVMNYALLVVFLVMLFFFRRIELALMGDIPIILSGIVTMGFIYIFQLKLNIFSLIVTTLIIGVGVDLSIFMTSALQKRYTTGINELKTYRTSIILAALTTILSIGVLVFAKHPALKSIASIALIGITSAVLITFTFYPLIFNLFITSRPQKGKPPVSLSLFVTAILSFGYFGAGSLLLSLLGLFLKIVPLKRQKKQPWLRGLIAKFTKSVMYSNYNVKNRVKNPFSETFEKPALIVANHSSFLDTLSLGFLKTQTIFLVNSWVYHSPVFGKAIQSAGYIPVEKGIETGEKEIVEKIKQGISVVVFPEATRSFTGALGRFHKGALLLAQKHQLDIVPLFIHGNFNLLPKGDFIIYDGRHTLTLGRRLHFDAEKEKESVRNLTKSFSRSFKNTFQDIRQSLEHEDYFKQKVLLNFLYKERDVVQRAKQEFEQNKKLYYHLNAFIPDSAKVLRIGDDLGIWDMMLVLQQGKRTVFSYIQDEECRNVARQSYLTKSRTLLYLDWPKNDKAQILLLTTELEAEELTQIVNNGAFKKIIIVSRKINLKLMHSLGFVLQQRNDSFKILNRQ